MIARNLEPQDLNSRLQGIKAESEERLHENLFSLDTSRPLRLDEFQQNLRSSCAEAALSLKEDRKEGREGKGGGQTFPLRGFNRFKPFKRFWAQTFPLRKGVNGSNGFWAPTFPLRKGSTG